MVVKYYNRKTLKRRLLKEKVRTYLITVTSIYQIVREGLNVVDIDIRARDQDRKVYKNGGFWRLFTKEMHFMYIWNIANNVMYDHTCQEKHTVRVKDFTWKNKVEYRGSKILSPYLRWRHNVFH